jgi:hypothetical protein
MSNIDFGGVAAGKGRRAGPEGTPDRRDAQAGSGQAGRGGHPRCRAGDIITGLGATGGEIGDVDCVCVVIAERLGRIQKGVRLRGLVFFVVVTAGAVVMPVMVMVIVMGAVRGGVRVDVRAEAVAGWLDAAVAVAEAGPLGQQDARHQEQANDALHGSSLFENHPTL